MDEMLLIVNPKSGVHKSKNQIIETAARLCKSKGLRFNMEYTTGPGSGKELAARAAAEGIRLVAVAGGDGTIRDVADGVWGTDTVMAVIPMGSGNGLARSMSVPIEPEKALDLVLKNKNAVIDRGIAGGQSFYSAFGVGFDAEVSYKFSLDGRRGKSTYIKHALKEIFTYKPRKFKLVMGNDHIETEALLIAVCNCKQYGSNAYIAPHADPSDGMLDITVVHKGNFFAKAVAGFDLFSGTLDKNVLVECFKANNIIIEGETAHMTHVDGEPTEMSSSIDIVCEPKGLKIAVPENVQPFKPIISPLKSMFDDLVVEIKNGLKQT